MAKRKFKLTKAEQKELLQAYRHCKDAATRTRYQAVRLYGEGYAEAEIEQITGCSRTSLMEWCRAYREDPSQGLVDKRVGGTRAKLSKLRTGRAATNVTSVHAQRTIRNKRQQWMGSTGAWKTWCRWCESAMVLNIKVAPPTVSSCDNAGLAIKRPRRSSSLAARRRWQILKNSSKKTDRCGSRCTAILFSWLVMKPDCTCKPPLAMSGLRPDKPRSFEPIRDEPRPISMAA